MENKMEFQVSKLISKTFKKAGESWKLYTIVLETTKDDVTTQNNYSCFDGLGKKEGSKSLKLDDLKENEIYSFGIISSEKGNTISFVQVPKEKPDFNIKNQTIGKKFGNGGEITKVEFNKDCEIFQQFILEYVTECHKQKKTINAKHYFGCFLWTFNKELGLSELMEWLNDVYENKVKMEAQFLENSYDEIKM